MSKLPEDWKSVELPASTALIPDWNQYDTNEYYQMGPLEEEEFILALLDKNIKIGKTKAKLPEGWKSCTESNYEFIVTRLTTVTFNNSTKKYNWPIRCVRLYKPNYPIKHV